MLPDVLWRMTWNDYARAVRGYQTRQAREWERTRQLGEWVAAFAGVDLTKELKGKRLLSLPTDPPPKKEAVPTETPEQFMARMKANNFYLNGNPGRA
ncbi:hypothetical protein GCM10027048_27700 [Hymenobacter coalescens]